MCWKAELDYIFLKSRLSSEQVNALNPSHDDFLKRSHLSKCLDHTEQWLKSLFKQTDDHVNMLEQSTQSN